MPGSILLPSASACTFIYVGFFFVFFLQFEQWIVFMMPKSKAKNTITIWTMNTFHTSATAGKCKHIQEMYLWNYIYVPVRACMHMYVRACVCACACVYLYVCVCLHMCGLSPVPSLAWVTLLLRWQRGETSLNAPCLREAERLQA